MSDWQTRAEKLGQELVLARRRIAELVEEARIGRLLAEALGLTSEANAPKLCPHGYSFASVPGDPTPIGCVGCMYERFEKQKGGER